MGVRNGAQRRVLSRRRYLHLSFCTALPIDAVEVSSPRRYQGAGLTKGRSYTSLRTQQPAQFVFYYDSEMEYSPYRFLQVSIGGEGDEPGADRILCDCRKQTFCRVPQSTELQRQHTSPLRAQLTSDLSYTN